MLQWLTGERGLGGTRPHWGPAGGHFCATWSLYEKCYWTDWLDSASSLHSLGSAPAVSSRAIFVRVSCFAVLRKEEGMATHSFVLSQLML